MEALAYIEKIKQVVLSRYDELKKPFYGHEPNLTAVLFSIKTISEKYIHGGAGDRDIDRFICFRDEDWYLYEIETEITAIYEPSFKITEINNRRLSDLELQDFLNSSDCSFNEVDSFIKTYKEISSKYPEEIKHI